jgi:hypothetical protein
MVYQKALAKYCVAAYSHIREEMPKKGSVTKIVKHLVLTVDCIYPAFLMFVMNDWHRGFFVICNEINVM